LCSAQTAYTTIGDEHQLRINSNGSIGVNIQNIEPASFDNGDTQRPYLRQAGLWIVAQDEMNNFHTAVQYLSTKDSFDFWPGPIDTLTGQTGDISEWDKTWKVTKEEVKDHIANYDKDDYITPNTIANWPAQGYGSFATYLAPFVDVDGNKLYNPEYGDYPAIKGDESAYFIFNDLANEHKASFGQDFGIEVQLMAYSVKGSSTTFLEYFIINRGSLNFKNLKIGFFIDGQCGNRNDNYAGTFESFPKSIFVYNADNMDEGYFGNDRPYVTASFLNENLSSSIAFNDQDGINGVPKINQEFINYSSNKWRDESNITKGGDGTGSGSPTTLIFAQSDESKPSFWSEEAESNLSGSRTIIGFMDAGILNSKNHKKIDMSLDVGYVKSSENIKDVIRQKSSTSLSYFRSISRTNSHQLEVPFNILPNPSNGVFSITNTHFGDQINISNNQGVTVYTKNILEKIDNQCNINLPPGYYTIQLTTKHNTVTKKLWITY
jgi:hypothetical protein